MLSGMEDLEGFSKVKGMTWVGYRILEGRIVLRSSWETKKLSLGSRDGSLPGRFRDRMQPASSLNRPLYLTPCAISNVMIG